MPDDKCDLPAITPSLTEFAYFYKKRKVYYACQYAVTMQASIDDGKKLCPCLGEPNVKLEG